MIIGRAVSQVRNAVVTVTEWVGMPTLILSNRVAIRYSFSMKGGCIDLYPGFDIVAHFI